MNDWIPTDMAKTSELSPTRQPAHHVGHGKAVTILLLGTLCLAFSGIWVKASNFEPATSVVLRCWLALFFLVPFAIVEIRKKGTLNKNGIIWAAIAGLILGVDFTAWNYSIFYVGAGIASVLLNLQVIILPLLAFFIDRERIPRNYWFVLPVMAVGIAMVGGVFDPVGEAVGPAAIAGIPIAILGTLLGALSGVCYGTYLYTSRKSTRVNPGRYLQPIAIVSLFQGFPPIAYMIFRGEGFNFTQGMLNAEGVLPTAPDGAFDPTGGAPIDGMNWLWMIMLAVLGQFIAWTFVQIGSVNMNPTLSAGLLLLSPVSTIFIAAILFSEIPSTLQVIGVVAVLGAVAYQNGLFHAMLGRSASDKKDVPPGTDIYDQTQDDPLRLLGENTPDEPADETSESPPASR
ncbi:DMT family transporter [uncultured Brachybacterium sp.]|uniref:DMT family transporter n=1 Tax=uncultured Brachybacterium sp. TaxID=189680 RepID=UPI00260D5E4C|nr:DMT family transporter [uncultured Brachybacterium sp.]